MKRFSGYKILNLVLALVLTSAVFMQSVSAVSLADPVDQFSVSSPGPNSQVSGVVNTIWRVSDDEQSSIPYEINLLDTGTCSTKIASVASGNVASSGNNITTSWNSAGSFPQIAKLNDGNYCMQVCVSLRNGTTPYSACNGRIITIRNTNRSPIITSSPPANRQITPTGNFSYDVNAYDPDGDPISYILLSNPSFITINSGSGVITIAQGSKPAGNYTITVQVRDSLGAVAQQSFDLTITGSQTSSSTTTTAAPTPTVKITSPIANEVFAGKTNEIKWEITNGGSVSEIALLYSTDGTNWKEIKKLSPTDTSYMWDVSDLTDGIYTLQVLLRTTGGQEIRHNSDPFEIKNKVDPNDLITKPLIVDVVPSDGANIRDRRPVISGKFTPPIDGTIDITKFKFLLDDQDRADLCEVTPAEFKCTLSSDLDLGVHKVVAEIQDFKQQVAEKEWNFTIIEDVTTTSSPSGQNQGGGIFIGDRFIPRESLVWAVLICCGALLLLLIPWILYSIWRRREEGDRTEVTVNTEPPAPVMPEISYTVAPQQTEGTTTPEVNVNYYYPEYLSSQEPQTLDSLQPTVTVNTETVPTDSTEIKVEPDIIIEPEVIPEPVAGTTQNIEVNTPAAVIEAEPLAPATEPASDLVPSSQPDTSTTQTDPLAPASNQPEWLNTTETASTDSPQNATEPQKKDSAMNAYGYGSKID